MEEQTNRRKPAKMERVTRARLTQGIGDMLDELVEAYQVDESELIRRLIVDAHKRRPALGGEVLMPVKSVARLSMTA
jgi:hypothetical protein